MLKLYTLNFIIIYEIFKGYTLFTITIIKKY